MIDGTAATGGSEHGTNQSNTAVVAVAEGRRMAAHGEDDFRSAVDSLGRFGFSGAPAGDPSAATVVCSTLRRTIGNSVERVAREVLDVVLHQHHRQVWLVAGTDAGIPNWYFGAYTTYLDWWLAVGQREAIVLERAAAAAARALEQGGVTGHITLASTADLLVDGDSRSTPGILAVPRLVLHRRTADRPGSAQ
ncbi:hypothetical protein [Saccharothrix obliqua]|uniref:hypothetical protein n=1 Tax=Saccharothrix obliqua TaxID=2861747 RepID=UPI001C5D5379|nr:hypothetical protein [Saccharothrix obliqua]MBW4717872.1 hypothetical protein [Saccharothrix obliqua]